MNQLNTLPRAAGASALMPVMVAKELKAVKKAIDDVMRTFMQEEVHYGKVPGSKKHSLFKAGAEALCRTFGLVPEIKSTVIADDPSRTWEWTQRRKDDTGSWSEETGSAEHFYEVESSCTLYGPAGNILGKASANANSWEMKYRKQTNPDIRNTVLKIAEKRALVAATLIATGCSDIFTQDVEDQGTGGRPAGASGGSSPQRQAAAGGEVKSNLTPNQVKACFAKGKDMGVDHGIIEAAVKGISRDGCKAFMDGVFAGRKEVFAPWANPATPPAAGPATDPAGEAKGGGEDTGWPEEGR